MANTSYRRHFVHDGLTSGPASISGVVRVLTQPVSRPVYLYPQDTMQVRRATRSASDGTYSFPNVATGTQWLVVAVDTDGAYNAVVADRVQT